jgi:hypothetical protein
MSISCRLDIIVIRVIGVLRMTGLAVIILNAMNACEDLNLHPRAQTAIPKMHVGRDNLLNGPANQIYAIACTTGYSLGRTVERTTPAVGHD